MPARDRLVGPWGPAHIASLTPRRISQALAGYEVRKPTIIPSCIMNQNTGLAGVRWGWVNSTKYVSAIHANRPTSKAVSE